jgi:antitoxin component of MazEF toxin-antitoxin module
MTSDYKKYSLEKLQDWVHDAMNSDASPHEIYSAIREAVREDYYYHKDCISRASGLLELLSGHRPVKSDDSKNWDAWEETYYPEEVKDDGMRPWGHSDLEYLVANKKEDKVKKWVLPVEECKDADIDETEYFVSLPDDLLEAANLKEGDRVEWVDQGDGSYLLKKVQPTYTSHADMIDTSHADMIANGYIMTDDGFWIRE